MRARTTTLLAATLATAASRTRVRGERIVAGLFGGSATRDGQAVARIGRRIAE